MPLIREQGYEMRKNFSNLADVHNYQRYCNILKPGFGSLIIKFEKNNMEITGFIKKSTKFVDYLLIMQTTRLQYTSPEQQICCCICCCCMPQGIL